MTYSIASLIVSAICFLAAWLLARRKAKRAAPSFRPTPWDEFRSHVLRTSGHSSFTRALHDGEVTLWPGHWCSVPDLPPAWLNGEEPSCTFAEAVAAGEIPPMQAVARLQSDKVAEALSVFDDLSTCDEVPSDTNSTMAQEPEPQSDAESPAPELPGWRSDWAIQWVDSTGELRDYSNLVWSGTSGWGPRNVTSTLSIPDPSPSGFVSLTTGGGVLSYSDSPTVSCSSAAAFLGYATDSADEGAAEGSTRDPVAEPEGETRCPVAEFAEGDWALSQHGTVYQVGPFSGAARGTLLRRAADGFVVGDEVRDEHGTNYLVEMHGEAPKGEWAGGPAVGNERLWRHSWAPVLLNPVQLTSPWVGRRVHTGSGESQLCVWADQDTLTLSDGSTAAASGAELHWDDVRAGDCSLYTSSLGIPNRHHNRITDRCGDQINYVHGRDSLPVHWTKFYPPGVLDTVERSA